MCGEPPRELTDGGGYPWWQGRPAVSRQLLGDTDIVTWSSRGS